MQRLYNGVQITGRGLLAQSMDLLQQFTSIKPQLVSSQSWIFLQQFGFLLLKTKNRIPKDLQCRRPGLDKRNVEGSLMGNPGIAGAGVVIRGAFGFLLAAESVLLGEDTSMFAEAAGLWKGLQLCHELGLQHVEVESDFQQLVHFMKSNSSGPRRLR